MHVPNEGIVLLAKLPGITSFSALWQIKNALEINKTGHTGTLDTFAEGLLVALTGRYTRLVPYITDCDKEYVALVKFGSETDTLDREGTVIHTAEPPLFSSIQASLPKFRGSILQTPPEYSAVHVNGKRASDRVRQGEAVTIPPREVTIHELELMSPSPANMDCDGRVASCQLRVLCSKGTYIRSLARDIALASGSRAHLVSLRRTRIGPFRLEHAAGFAMLEPFGSVSEYRYGVGERPPRINADEIRRSIRNFNEEVAISIGMRPIQLITEKRVAFSNGIKPDASWFNGVLEPSNAVFCEGTFMGTIVCADDTVSYGFVFGGGN